MSATLSEMFHWLIRASWQGAVLVLLVMAAQWVLRRKLAARWRHAIWSLVLIRLLLPSSLPSALSVFNYLPLDRATAMTARPSVASAPAEDLPDHSSRSVGGEAASTPVANPLGADATGSPNDPDASAISRATGFRTTISDWLDNFDPMNVAATIWALGVLLLTLRVLIQNNAFSRRLRAATVVTDPAIRELFETCQAHFNLRRPIKILETPEVKSPALYGFFRPALLLPAGLTAGFNRDELRYIFLHELAHVKRRDMPMLWLVSGLRILHWFNPILWFGFRRMAADRELACDELALTQAGEAASRPYGETIIKLLENAARPAAFPGLMGMTENRNQLARRISMIAAFRRHPTGSGLALLLAGALGCITLTDARKTTAPVTDSSDEVHLIVTTNIASRSWLETMEVLAINGTNGTPISGVEIEVWIDQQGRTTNHYTTDATGLAQLALPTNRPPTVHLTANKDGFLESYTFWMPTQGNVNLPARYTLALDPGELIGGIVRGRTGRPAGNAEVEFSCETDVIQPGASPWIENDPANIRRHFNYMSPVVADQNGAWRARVETGKLKWVSASIRHPQHIPGEFEIKSQSDIMEQLRARRLVTVLEPGFEVSGTVLDSTGRPITNGAVREVGAFRGPVVSTDATGRFVLDRHYPPGVISLVVQAPDLSPERRQITVSAELKPQEFRLPPGQTIRARVVDGEGKPVVGVRVAVANWHAERMEAIQYGSDVKFETRTDAEGRFVWKSAPADEVRFSIYHPKYRTLSDYRLMSGLNEQVIKLLPILEVYGRVTDSATGQPVPAFRIIPGQAGFGWPLERVNWSRVNATGWQSGITEFQNGDYSMRFAGPLISGGNEQADYRLRFEADGYEASVSRPVRFDEGRQEWNVKLVRSTNVASIVRASDGQPVAGVEIYVINGSRPPCIVNGRVSTSQITDSHKLVTDRNGAYSLVPEDGDCPVIFLHNRGWLETSFKKLIAAPNVTLLPWGRIEGVLKFGKRPAVNEELSLEFPGAFRGPMLDYEAKTDAGGRFHFDRVPPGEVTVTRQVGVLQDSLPMTLGEPIAVKAGATIRVNLGGTGRAVVGRFREPPGLSAKADWEYGSLRIYSTRTNDLVLPMPEGLGKEAEEKWLNEWDKTPPGRAFQRKEELIHFGIPGKPVADGTFRFDDVPTGEYRLEFQLRERPVNDNNPFREFMHPEVIATAAKTFAIPAMSSGRSDEPLDLGGLATTLRPRAVVGQPAPPLEVKTVDGQTFRLADHRGKFVLLNFWTAPATGDVANSAAQTGIDALKSIYEGFGAEGRLVMLGLIPEDGAKPGLTARTKEYLNRINPPWPQVLLGAWDAPVRINYGVEKLPTAFLIGPDGNVLAKVFEGESVLTVVSRAIARSQGVAQK